MIAGVLVAWASATTMMTVDYVSLAVAGSRHALTTPERSSFHRRPFKKLVTPTRPSVELVLETLRVNRQVRRPHDIKSLGAILG